MDQYLNAIPSKIKYTNDQKKALARMALAKAEFGVGYTPEIESILASIEKQIKQSG